MYFFPKPLLLVFLQAVAHQLVHYPCAGYTPNLHNASIAVSNRYKDVPHNKGFHFLQAYTMLKKVGMLLFQPHLLERHFLPDTLYQIFSPP